MPGITPVASRNVCRASRLRLKFTIQRPSWPRRATAKRREHPSPAALAVCAARQFNNTAYAAIYAQPAFNPRPLFTVCSPGCFGGLAATRSAPLALHRSASIEPSVSVHRGCAASRPRQHRASPGSFGAQQFLVLVSASLAAGSGGSVRNRACFDQQVARGTAPAEVETVCKHSARSTAGNGA